MAYLRIFVVSFFAPVSACAIVSLVLIGTINPGLFMPLVFAWPGSLLLATSYAMLGDRGETLQRRYATLIVIGAVVGGIVLGLPSAKHLEGAKIGSAYGLLTALCWISLHALTRQWAPSAGKPSRLSKR